MTAVAWRELVTPEGVDLRLKVGSAGERLFALVLDMLIIGALLLALTLGMIALALALRWQAGWEVVTVIWLLGAFLIRNFYFTGFELRPAAATPGKRAQGLRVIARNGGQLKADMVFTRNAMRELELFLPLSVLGGAGAGVDGWLVVLGLVWTGVFALFPLFNRDRLRAGDLVAGTLVVKAPKRRLQADLAAAPGGDEAAAFTTAQLDAYGVKELHVLEEVLRRGDPGVMTDVARRISAKIGMIEPPASGARAFLTAYYAALRGRLEQRMLFGHRRKDKFDRG